jgi:hypothetical protein
MCFRYVGTLEDLYAGAQVLHGKSIVPQLAAGHIAVSIALRHTRTSIIKNIALEGRIGESLARADPTGAG